MVKLDNVCLSSHLEDGLFSQMHGVSLTVLYLEVLSNFSPFHYRRINTFKLSENCGLISGAVL